MALVPCNVCGTLNSEDAEICLSCEYPIKGRRRPEIFKWAAVLLFILFTAPLINLALNYFKPKNQPKPSPSITLIEGEREGLKVSGLKPLFKVDYC